MPMGRGQPSIVIDMQVLVTHADSVAIMEREMGHPPRIIRAPDACYLFQARDQERLSGLVDREECDQTTQPPTDKHVSDGTMDAPRETDASFEEIER
jgi:hypothetical protein